MKHTRTILLLLIIIFLLITGAYQHIYVRSVSDRLLSLSEELSADILLNNREQAKENLLELESLWRRNSDKLSAMIEHTLVSNISISLAELSADIAAENYTQLPAEAARLTEQIRILAKTGHITLANIF